MAAAETCIRFQYMSDLHLELFPGFRIKERGAPYLILAGDVGCPRDAEYGDFVAHAAEMFDLVFVVLGNHEGYGYATWAEACVAVRGVCSRHSNVVFLDRSSYDISVERTFDREAAEKTNEHDGNAGAGKVRVVGTTLWSQVPDDSARDVGCFLADYRRIGDLCDVSDTNALHLRDLTFLLSSIARAEADGVPLVVVTHHAPSMRGTSHPRNSGSRLNHAFASPLDALLRPPVAAWVHGHTHFSHSSLRKKTNIDPPIDVDSKVDPPRTATMLLSNQRGYEGEDGVGFRPDATFAVDILSFGGLCETFLDAAGANLKT